MADRRATVRRVAAWCLGWLVAWGPPVAAETFEIWPPAGCESSEEFEQAANGLGPGDELILHQGSYCQTGRRFVEIHGTQAAPVIVRGAEGEGVPLLTRPDDPAGPQSHNGIEIAGEHFVLRRLHFERGSSGVRFLAGTHHVTVEDCEIDHTANNALTMNSGDTDACTVQRCHIHHTGLLDEAHGTTEGEGMYIGCNNASCIASNHLFAFNYIHDLRSTSGGGNDGIEIKYGSYGNEIRDNVIHTTTLGRRYPCVLVYGVRDQDIDRPNRIERNAMWDCGQAIHVTSDAVVRNNIVLDSDQGLFAAPHAQVAVVRNVTIANNTFAGHTLYIRWDGASGMVLANNAIYHPGGAALDVQGMDAQVVENNCVQGSGVTVDGDAFLDGGTLDEAFSDPASRDYWPAGGSPLRGAADAALAPADDFNALARTAPCDVGAYEAEGQDQNPGWQLEPDFKDPAGTQPDTVPPAAPAGLQVTAP